MGRQTNRTKLIFAFCNFANMPKSYTHKQEQNIIFTDREKNTFFTAVLKSKRVTHSLHSYLQDNAYRCHEWGSAHMTFTALLLSWSKLWSLWIPSSNCTFTHNIRFWRGFWRLLTALALKPVLLCNINFMTANTNKYNFSWMLITCNTQINGPLIQCFATSRIWCTSL